MTATLELAVGQQMGWDCTGNVSLTLDGNDRVKCAAKNERRARHAVRLRQKIEGLHHRQLG